MSLYNMLFGNNAAAGILLNMLDLSPESVGRFRDCYPSEDGTKIIVFTRNGGGNRESYQCVLDELSKHPNWVRDYDDDFDCTYASIEFTVPEPFGEIVKMIADQTDTRPPMEKFSKLIDDLQRGEQNAVTSRAIDVGKRILGKLEEGGSGAVTTPEGGVTIVKL